MKLAILWPANPTVEGEMLPEEADISRVKKDVETLGAVYWDSFPRRKEIREPVNGYIYVCPNGGVRYKCRVEQVIRLPTLISSKSEHKYIPWFREQCWKGRWPKKSGKSGHHWQSNTWIKISKIIKLKQSRPIGSLLKLDGTPVRGIRGGLVYIRDPFP